MLRVPPLWIGLCEIGRSDNGNNGDNGGIYRTLHIALRNGVGSANNRSVAVALLLFPYMFFNDATSNDTISTIIIYIISVRIIYILLKNIEDVVLDITVLNVVVNIHLQRYIDTENNNAYIADNVGKCNRLDKCGYHYTPRQYFEDNPWLRDKDNSCCLLHR